MGDFPLKAIISNVITVLIVAAGLVLSLLGGIRLSAVQQGTLLILAIICAVSAAYCFLAGQLSGNTSQMDKLWSILPIVYAWVIAIRGGLTLRLTVIAVLITLWGVRLTYNFSLKGAYTLPIWAGREDYRWQVLRQHKILGKPVIWALFNLLFISLYQNALVLAICLPALAVMDSPAPFGIPDAVAAVLMLGFLALETVADRQQWLFHSKKKELLGSGGSLASLPLPYSRGFNTTGLWAYSRHPNYFAEQAFWLSLCLVTLGKGISHMAVFHWSFVGALLLVLLFMGSSAFGESVSARKYPEYATYQSKVSKYIPFRKYRP